MAGEREVQKFNPTESKHEVSGRSEGQSFSGIAHEVAKSFEDGVRRATQGFSGTTDRGQQNAEADKVLPKVSIGGRNSVDAGAASLVTKPEPADGAHKLVTKPEPASRADKVVTRPEPASDVVTRPEPASTLVTKPEPANGASDRMPLHDALEKLAKAAGRSGISELGKSMSDAGKKALDGKDVNPLSIGKQVGELGKTAGEAVGKGIKALGEGSKDPNEGTKSKSETLKKDDNGLDDQKRKPYIPWGPTGKPSDNTDGHAEKPAGTSKTVDKVAPRSQSEEKADADGHEHQAPAPHDVNVPAMGGKPYAY